MIFTDDYDTFEINPVFNSFLKNLFQSIFSLKSIFISEKKIFEIKKKVFSSKWIFFLKSKIETEEEPKVFNFKLLIRIV